MAQRVKSLRGKHEGLSSILRTNMRGREPCASKVPELGSEADPRGSPRGSQISKLQVSQACFKK